jgi:hypothetical protein
MHRFKSVLIAALLLVGATAFAQQIQVTGVVTSRADGYGVIGAAVMEKGTTNGAVPTLTVLHNYSGRRDYSGGQLHRLRHH